MSFPMDDDRVQPERSASLPTYEFPISSATPTATNEGRSNPLKRKLTLIALLDELTMLKEEEMGLPALPLAEEKKSKLESVDDRFQIEGAQVFKNFEGLVKALDKELQNFANAARQLGSSVGLLSSAFHLRQRLTDILFVFRENAAELFPGKIKKAPIEVVNRFSRKGMVNRRRPPINVTRPMAEDMDPEALPTQLKSLARDLTVFLRCLNEFPEFTDEAVNASLMAFDGDLQYWGSTLQDFKGQFRFPAVQRYVHDLSTEMASHIESITASLKIFVEVGVPTIRFAQKQASNNLLNLSTISAFFSGVTATTIQYSFDKLDTDIAMAVNVFLFSSLVLSIAATVNSLLGLTWKHAMYRSPRHRVPWWVLIWIKRSPLIFMVISVAAFSVGLVLFTYATQPYFIATITLILTSFSSLGLIAVSSWFAAERWTFSRHKGRKWLDDIVFDTKKRILKSTGLEWCFSVPPSHVKKHTVTVARHVKRAATWSGTSITRVFSNVGLAAPGTSAGSDQEDGLNASTLEMNPSTSAPPSPVVYATHLRRASDAPSNRNVTIDDKNVATPGPSTATPLSTRANSLPGSPGGGLKGIGRFANVGWRVANMVKSTPISAASAFGGPPKRQGTKLTVASDQGTPRSRGNTLNEPLLMAPSRLANLVPALKQLREEYVLDEHLALVRHLQFSPNGKWLATCSWDRTCRIWQVPLLSGDAFETRHVLTHLSGFVGQVAWSPDSSLLLAKLARSIKIWTLGGVCKRTIERHHMVTSVTWLPSGKGFLSVEGSTVYSLDLSGKVVDTYILERLDLQDVAVTPDEQRLFAVATLLESADGLQPIKSRAEKRIIAYNLEEKAIENQVPVLHDVRDITLSRNGQLALVSYENKAPPQLWRIDRVKGDARLALLQTYMPKTEVDFAGTSYFAGPTTGDELVLCPEKGGDILIWDRESGILLHSVRAQDKGGDLTGIAWNNSSSNFMFASASHDGTVKIWTSPESNCIPPGGNDSESVDLGTLFRRRNSQRPERSSSEASGGHNKLFHMETASPNGTQLDFQDDPDPDGVVDSPVASESAETSRPPETKRSIFFAH